MSLSFTFGAMNGGKSTLLLQSAHSYRSRGFEVILLRMGVNTREADIRSRMGLAYSADLVVHEETDLLETLRKQVAKLPEAAVKAVLVDEAQFLTPRQVEELAVYALESGIDIACYGLKTSFELKLFPGSKRLLELADSFVELDVVLCPCGNKAKVNARFNAATGELITEGPERFIEGAVQEVIYDPVCLRCYVAMGGELL